MVKHRICVAIQRRTLYNINAKKICTRRPKREDSLAVVKGVPAKRRHRCNAPTEHAMPNARSR